MNLLQISKPNSRRDSFAVPVIRTAFRRERKNGRNRSPHKACGHSQSTQLVRLEFFHPQAREVNIAGSFNDWRPGATWMISLGNGRWVKEILLPPGRYEYCFVVDGHWMPHQRIKESTPGPSEDRNSVLIVPHPNGNGHPRSLILQPQQREMQHCCASTQ